MYALINNNQRSAEADFMYIKDYGYGRSKRCRRKTWPIIGLCILTIGLGSLTTQVMAGYLRESGTEENGWTELPGSLTADNGWMELSGPETVEKMNAPMAAGAGEAISVETVEAGAPLIVIDPGHGGEDEGCSRAGVEEKDINLQIGLVLQDRLLQRGYEVLLTRKEDITVSLEQRVQAANEAGADAYISIHQNACEEDNRVAGVETWYNGVEEEKDSRRLASLIHKEAVLSAEAADRDLRENDTLYVIRETNMPSCLVETGFLSNAKDRKNLSDPKYQEEIADGIADGIDLYFHPKTMYLTFDDGPSAENTCAILDILKKRDIKATFFVIGENVRKNPEVAKRIVAEGHTIGIHCNNHDYQKLYQSVDSYIKDFEEAFQTVYEVTGVKAELFRFPGGSINAYNKKVYKDIITEMTERGFVYFDWNASLEDAVSKSDPATLVKNAEETTLGRKKVILLAHDVIYNTTLCIEEIIDRFPEYQMDALTPEVTPIQF